MNKPFAVISLLCLSLALASFSVAPANDPNIPVHGIRATTDYTSGSLLYNALCLEEKGLSKKAFDLAYKGYQRLVKKNRISNTGYLTICDMSQPSRNKRLYLIDLSNTEVLLHTWVAHGRNSGHDYATRFSNKLSSRQTSLGFYVTKNTYFGEHGLSLRMQGLEPGFNDKAYRRAVVIHGADYIGGEKNKTGRSYGCPAIPREEVGNLINTIKDGSCLFIYHPTRYYLAKSKILNG